MQAIESKHITPESYVYNLLIKHKSNIMKGVVLLLAILTGIAIYQFTGSKSTLASHDLANTTLRKAVAAADTEKALNLYNQLSSNPAISQSYTAPIAQLLVTSQNYDKARELYNNYANRTSDDYMKTYNEITLLSLQQKEKITISSNPTSPIYQLIAYIVTPDHGITPISTLLEQNSQFTPLLKENHFELEDYLALKQ